MGMRRNMGMPMKLFVMPASGVTESELFLCVDVDGRGVEALVRQASAPVRWMETVQRMVEQGATHIVECGPGKVLAAMTRRIHPGVQSFSLADRASLEQALQAMTGA